MRQIDQPFILLVLKFSDINDVSSNIAIAIHLPEQLLQPQLMRFMLNATFLRF